MSEHARFHLVYDGPALQEHRMDVRDLAPALLALGDLVERANEILNGESVRVSVNVRASFKTGSFGIDMEVVQDWWQYAIGVINGPGVVGALNIAGLIGIGAAARAGLIRVVKWLRGRGVTKIEPISDGVVRLHVDADHLDVEERVLRLLQDYKVRKHLETLIAKPLSREGIDTFAIATDDVKEITVEVPRSHAHYFAAPPATEELLDQTEYTVNLQVLNVAFQDGNKWRFTDGGQSFYATVSDDAFNERVAANQEAFAKDDVLRARVRRTQRITSEGLATEYEVLEVLEHRAVAPRVQLSMALKPPE